GLRRRWERALETRGERAHDLVRILGEEASLDRAVVARRGALRACELQERADRVGAHVGAIVRERGAERGGDGGRGGRGPTGGEARGSTGAFVAEGSFARPSATLSRSRSAPTSASALRTRATAAASP